tara:strand:- start:389 stop:598 length:210 start_codon:yes stop_codon:yes gene_type:complete
MTKKDRNSEKTNTISLVVLLRLLVMFLKKNTSEPLWINGIINLRKKNFVGDDNKNKSIDAAKPCLITLE